MLAELRKELSHSIASKGPSDVTENSPSMAGVEVGGGAVTVGRGVALERAGVAEGGATIGADVRVAAGATDAAGAAVAPGVLGRRPQPATSAAKRRSNPPGRLRDRGMFIRLSRVSSQGRRLERSGRNRVS